MRCVARELNLHLPAPLATTIHPDPHSPHSACSRLAVGSIIGISSTRRRFKCCDNECQHSESRLKRAQELQTQRERESDGEGDRKRDGATDLGALELFAYAAKNVEHVDNI